VTLIDLPLLVDRAEAAGALRCSEVVIDRLVAAGRLEPVHLLPDDDDAVRFRPEDLMRVVDDATHGGIQ
jgi:hypothetical protein